MSTNHAATKEVVSLEEALPATGPLRNLAAFLGRVLDEDQWATAEALLVKLATPSDRFCGNCADGYPGGPDNCGKCSSYSSWTPLHAQTENALRQQLLGRIAYLRNVGRVKDPELMERAVEVIDSLVAATSALLSDMGAPDDGAEANLMDKCRAAISNAA